MNCNENKEDKAIAKYKENKGKSESKAVSGEKVLILPNLLDIKILSAFNVWEQVILLLTVPTRELWS